MERLKKRILIPVLLLLAAVLGGVYYVNDYYHSDDHAKDYLAGTEQVTVTEIAEGLFLDGGGTGSAMIFYPGAKVEYTAYLPLLCKLAEQGTDCFLIRMPCNLAILGQNKAGRIQEEYDYEEWYLAGHSLGGAMAAVYAAGHSGEFDGLILLASYPTKSLKGSGISVLSVYGSEDGILNMEKVEAGRELMPEAYSEICIEGGNHAQFGNYGMQSGDGEAQISGEEQQMQTVQAILPLTGRKEPEAIAAAEELEHEKESNMENQKITYQQITAEQAKESMDSDEHIIVLDVRTEEEYQNGHIPGAVLLPNETIGTEQPKELPDKDQKILVYCRSGNRSRQAAAKLAEMGYTNIYEFGGIMSWPYETEKD